ncbi:MAG: hypothetical protein AABY22_10570 [Nanoarchaeota archaeon]
MILHFLTKTEKEKTELKLKDQFGISKLPDKILQTGKEKIRIFTGSFSEKEIEKLSKTTHIEGIGLYIAKEENNQLRISIEGTHLLKDQIKRNIFELNEQQKEEWLQGQDLQIHTGKKGVFIMEYNGDFIGSGKISEEKISNFIPKGRRIKPNVS